VIGKARGHFKFLQHFVPASSLFVLDWRFARIYQALYLILDMITESIGGKDSGKRGWIRFLRTKNAAGACHISTSCRMVSNCGSKRFFIFTPELFLSDMS
jgi:hypothetical protein